jgi:D-proline reductase (dithiol) PrdB
VARTIEQHGIATVSLSLQRELTEKTRPPRALFLRWPFGHPLGEPFNAAQQHWILREALQALEELKEPGVIIDLPYLWRRPGPWTDNGRRKARGGREA